MGVVYRARDTKLEREVAIKLLPEAVAHDPDRLSRFEREAKVLASLNHPNIAQIYGVEDRALVMELVTGERLRGPLPLETALNYARQIAEALEAAHEKGIVHRDLKPGNVMVTEEGVIKVLDFGLAAIGQEWTSSDQSPANSPTLTMRATRDGTIMGTAAYMSPEQAAGKPVDKRSDIWSFGVVLAEMLTGKYLFEGETISHTLASVLQGPIDLGSLPEETPRAVRDLLSRCLERDVKMRFRDIGDVRIAIQQYLVHPEPEAAPESPARPAILPWAVAGVFALAAVYAFWSLLTRETAPPQVQRAAIEIPEGSHLPLTTDSNYLAISPDGSRLVYMSRNGDSTRLCVRRLDRSESQPLAGTLGATSPFFSPDSKWVGFVADGKLKKIPVDGGSPSVIGDVASDPYGAWWNSDNTITFNPGFGLGLLRVPADGGKPELLYKPDPARNETGYFWPQTLKDALLFTVAPDSITNFNEGRIVLAPRGKQGVMSLVANGAQGRVLPTGHLIYFHDGRMLAARFDAAGARLLGPAVPVLEGVKMNPTNGTAQFALSDTGTLAYLPGQLEEVRSTIAMLQRDGTEARTFDVKLDVGEMQPSPDGRRLVVRAFKANDDLHILDLETGTTQRFTFEGGDEMTPVWTPDGSRIVYGARRGGPIAIYSKAADGSTPPKLLTRGEYARRPFAVSPDGKFLLFTEQHPETGFDIWLMPLEAEAQAQGKPAEPKPWIRTPYNEEDVAFSPDGRWVALASTESGDEQVYVTRFPEGSPRRQVSTSGGALPIWSADGKEIVYRKGLGDGSGLAEFWAVDVATQPTFTCGAPRRLFTTSSPRVFYAALPGRRHFLMMKPAQQAPMRHIQMVFNWFEELKRRVPAGGN